MWVENAMAESDSQLLARCAAGDQAGLEALYRRHVERVWRYAWFRTHSRDEAADIVQDTFLRVARAAGSFEGRSAFTTWLFAIARSAAVNHARHENRHRETGDPQILRLVPSAEPDRATATALDAETRHAVRQAVAQLPGPQRDAIVLCELNALRVREAAEVLGWGESRVKTTLFRARRKLRDLLKEHVGESRAKRSG
jgi:RNA polymerase sigma-70 factor (ECF subfamily)